MQSMVSSEQTLTVEASNRVFGDNWYGVVKALVIVYKYGNEGVPITSVTTENEVFSLS